MNTILGQFKIGIDQAKIGALVQGQLKIGERQAIFGGLRRLSQKSFIMNTSMNENTNTKLRMNSAKVDVFSQFLTISFSVAVACWKL